MYMNRKISILILILLYFNSQVSSATPSVSVYTNKQVYEYGDFLSVTIHISELIGNQLILHITDSAGKTSSPIPIQISNLNDTISAPLPFYKTNYAPGTYRIDAEYSGSKSSGYFKLIDSDKIAIPPYYKELVRSWFQGIPNNSDYAGLIRELMSFNIIEVPNYQNKKIINIPKWVLNDAKWWSDDSISDNEFGHALQYLLQKGIISV